MWFSWCQWSWWEGGWPKGFHRVLHKTASLTTSRLLFTSRNNRWGLLLNCVSVLLTIALCLCVHSQTGLCLSSFFFARECWCMLGRYIHGARPVTVSLLQAQSLCGFCSHVAISCQDCLPVHLCSAGCFLRALRFLRHIDIQMIQIHLSQQLLSFSFHERKKPLKNQMIRQKSYS